MKGSSIKLSSPAVFMALSFAIKNVIAAKTDIIFIEEFDNSQFGWYTRNDTIMGGESYSTVDVKNNVGKLVGEVVNVPKLKAPGFIIMTANSQSFPDVSACEGIDLEARSLTDYDGYRMSFGEDHALSMRYGRGYKAPFNVGNEFEKIRLSFSQFSDYWNEATGEITVGCSSDNLQYCPTTATLRSLGHMSFWGEGVNGKVDLEVKSIKAYDCASKSDGDLFKTLINLFSSDPKTKDTEEVRSASASTGIETKITIPIAGMSLFIALVSLIVSWRVSCIRSRNDPKLVFKTEPGDEIL